LEDKTCDAVEKFTYHKLFENCSAHFALFTKCVFAYVFIFEVPDKLVSPLAYNGVYGLLTLLYY